MVKDAIMKLFNEVRGGVMHTYEYARGKWFLVAIGHSLRFAIIFMLLLTLLTIIATSVYHLLATFGVYPVLSTTVAASVTYTIGAFFGFLLVELTAMYYEFKAFEEVLKDLTREIDEGFKGESYDD